MPQPQLVLARHGATAWSKSGQHTGTTDLPLLPEGEDNGRRLAPRLAGLSFKLVLASPMSRARRTAELAGFANAEVDADLAEWNYGDYEGLTTHQIHERRPGWNLFRDGCPAGETAADVGRRADRVIARVRAAGDSLAFAHGHVLRVVAARWVGLPPEDAARFLLGTATLSILSYDHGPAEPAVQVWNDSSHLRPETPPK